MHRITTTGDEPVSVAEVKLAARLDGDELDGLIATRITTAREEAEQLTGRAYRPGVFRVELEDWPASTKALAVYRPTACEVRYWSGIEMVELADGAYAFAPGGPGGAGTVVAPAVGSAWPQLGVRAVGPRVQIDLTAGPESPDDVAACVKTFISATVCAWLNNVEALADKDLLTSPLMARLLDGERLWC